MISFEEASKELEKIVSRLEKGDVGLEEGTALFEKGLELVKTCSSMLENAKGKITVIKNELDKIVEDNFSDK
ncbi:MAG: exodeoxyribonuclease VII small subunit [Clostridia bacterium]